MSRYKETDKDQGQFVTVNFYEQLIAGSFEYTMSELIDKKLDLKVFDLKYNNDITGSKAIEPRILLKDYIVTII